MHPDDGLRVPAAVAEPPAGGHQAAGEPSPATLFPRFVCRVGGLPAAAATDALASEELGRLLDELHALERATAQRRDAVSDRLHELVGGETDGELRAARLNLRRRLYNGKPARPEELLLLPAAVRAEVEELGDLLHRRAEVRERLAAAYPRETARLRRGLQKALGESSFQHALVLSSPALFDAQDRYRRADPARLRARERQIERGLLRYWTRMATKATPFSTFCQILPGELVAPGHEAAGERETGGSGLVLRGDLAVTRTLVRLNKAFNTVVLHRLGREPALRRHLLVELNPTVREEGGVLRFLSTAGGREVFQRLPASPALELVRQALAGGEARTAHRLVAELAAREEVDLPEEAVGGYIDRLVEIGMLRLTTGIPAQDVEWDRRLAALLDGIDAAPARQAADFLRRLQELTAAFSAARQAGERRDLLATFDREFRAYREANDLRLRVNTPVYEDATAPARALWHRSAPVEGLEDELRRYVTATARLNVLRCDQATMRHLFDELYAGRQRVGLLEFYEDYYRRHYKAHLERELRARRGEAAAADEGYDLANPFGLEPVRGILAARRELASLVGQRWETATGDGIRLDLAEIEAICAATPPMPTRSAWSAVLYGELLDGGAEPVRFLLRNGGYSIGYGKMFSRFLDLFPADFTAALRDGNRRLSRHALAELCDDADFNANLHPPLFDEEISYPPGEGRGSGDRLLPSDLAVVRDPDDAFALLLIHPATGRRVLPVDTGFMSPDARPPLYRLLTTFNPTPSFRLPLPLGPGPAGATLGGVTVRPRIAVGDHLVLYRRTWLVPADRFPRQEPGESDAQHFQRLGTWRRDHGLPPEVYLRFQPVLGAFRQAGEEGSPPPRLAAEELKPQYLCFDSPLLAGLARTAAPAGDRFVALFEERLPRRLVEHRGAGRVSELVLQLDFPEAPGPRR
ncbi:MAG TPA: lantibiotic dehydratase [Thermoanaerobaculia bacterium]|nr:lantibiotic dehydratase [Thermoanaerobaculia bacterium]